MTSASGGAGPVPSPIKPHAPAVTISQYEFRESENAVVGHLGSKMSFVGLFMLGIGLCFVVSAIIHWQRREEIEVGLLFLTLLFMVFGIWTHRAGREFHKVASTEGSDVGHLMLALTNLLRLYSLVYLIFFIALIFAFIELTAASLGG